MTADEAFDAGVIALGRDDHPTAIASLLVARDAAPRDVEIASALETARESSGSRVHVDVPIPVAATDLGLLLLLVNVALCIAIARRVRRRLLVGTVAAWFVVLGALLTRVVTQPDYVVVVREGTKTYAADDVSSLERYQVTRGDELVLLEKRGAWLKVEGPEGPAYLAAGDAVEATRGNDVSETRSDTAK